MPESSAIFFNCGDNPRTVTRPPHSAAVRTRPRISPMPEESINGTSLKSKISFCGRTFFAVLSICSRISPAVWWSSSPRMEAVIAPPFNSIRKFIVFAPLRLEMSV